MLHLSDTNETNVPQKHPTLREKDQGSLPRNPYYSTEEINAYARGQAEMLLAGFRKVKKRDALREGNVKEK